MQNRVRRFDVRSTLIATMLTAPLLAGGCSTQFQTAVNSFFSANPALLNSMRAEMGLTPVQPATQVGGASTSDQVQNPVR